MSQLLMKWEGAPFDMPQPPEGYRLHQYRRGGDGALTEQEFHDQWTGIRKAKDEDPEKLERWYHTVYDDARVPDDGFFVALDSAGRIAASASVQLGEHAPGSATVHAVCTSPEHRSRGLGKLVTLAVMDYAVKHGIADTWLTTDDFRIPAVIIYLQLGFLPVLYEPDMRGRWLALMQKLGLDSIEVWDENGTKSALERG